MLRWSVVFAALISSVAYAQTLPPQTNDIHYGPYAAETLDISVPVGTPPATGWPTVMFIHGGGWTSGAKEVYAGRSPVCSTMTVACAASLGFAAVAIDYRLITATDPTTWWPAQILDAQLAVRWLRHNAASFHIDPNRICATGDSAGSSLALMLGARPAIFVGWDVSLLYPAASPQVECVVDNFGPMDWGPTLLQKPPAGYADPNPIAIDRIQGAMVPTMVVQGTADRMVVPQNGIDLFNKLTSMQLPTLFYSYPGGHEFTEADGKTSMSVTERMPILNAEYSFIRSALASVTTATH